MGTQLELRVSSREIEIDNERSGEFLGLSAADRLLLDRNGDINSASARYTHRTSDKHAFLFDLSVTEHDLDGDAMSYDGAAVELTHLLSLGKKNRLVTNLHFSNMEYDEINPIYVVKDELDRVGLLGSGTPPEPQGILGTAGINQVTGVGTPTDYSNIITGVRNLLDSNVALEDATRVAIMAPAIWAVYENLATGITSDNTQLPRPRSLENTEFLVTSNIPTTSPENYTLFLGDFRDLVLGIRREAAVEVLKVDSYVDNLVLEHIKHVPGLSGNPDLRIADRIG